MYKGASIRANYRSPRRPKPLTREAGGAEGWGAIWRGNGSRACSIVMLLALLAFTGIARAQAGRVTDNDVIRVAERMYCPVCENIPLDDCETRACVEWKAEIRAQLAAGRSDQAVIDSFVARFGDNVVGVPQDPVLRALTIIVPLLGVSLAAVTGVLAFRRFGAQQKLSLPPPASHTEVGEARRENGGQKTAEAYRRRLEDDVRGRR